MSGGRFNYFDNTAKNEIFGWSDVPRDVFEDREISELVWDVFNLIHDYDWYASGDTCEETYRKSVAKFKKKWFDNRAVRIKQIVDSSIRDLKSELYTTFGIRED